MMDDSTLRAIHLTVAANPGEDLPRIVHKERLQELADDAGEVPCPHKCVQLIGSEDRRYMLYENAGPDGRWVPCQYCAGTGTVRDTRAADRLAFVLVGEEIAELRPKVISRLLQKGGPVPDPVVIRYDKANTLHADLLRTYEREWRGCGACEACRGSGRIQGPYYLQDQTDDADCAICHGTGAACWPLVEEEMRWPAQGDWKPQPTQVTWEQGWITRITTTAANFLRPRVAGTIARYWPLASDGVVLSDGVIEDRIVGMTVYRMNNELTDALCPGGVDAYASMKNTVDALSRGATAFARREAARLFPKF